MTHFVYMVECADGTLYTGYTTDVEKRITEHNGEGSSKTARSAGGGVTRPPPPHYFTKTFIKTGTHPFIKEIYKTALKSHIIIKLK